MTTSYQNSNSAVASTDDDAWLAEQLRILETLGDDPEADAAALKAEEQQATERRQWLAERWALATEMVVRTMGEDDPVNGGEVVVPAQGDPRLQHADVAEEYGKLKARQAARDMLAAEEAQGKAATLDLTADKRWTVIAEQALEPPPFIADQIMPAGSNVLLIAERKTGKTTLVANTIRALVDGTPILGEFDTRHSGNVALWDYEMAPWQLSQWLAAQRINNTDRLRVEFLRGLRVPFDASEDQIVAWLETNETQTWIIDTYARAYGGDENSNSEVTRFLEAVDVIKNRAGVQQLIMTVHTGQGAETKGRARGAARLEDWCDVRWFLTKDPGNEDDRIFSANGRDVDYPKKRLGYNAETRRLWVAGDPVAVERKREASNSARQAVWEIVSRNPGISPRALRDEVKEAAGIGSGKADEAIKGALAAGMIQRQQGAGSGLEVASMSWTP